MHKTKWENLGGGYNCVVLKPESKFDSKKLFIAIGDNERRKDYVSKYKRDTELSFISIISKNAYVSQFAAINDGVLIADGAHIGPEAKIGAFSIINTNAVIEHEVRIGEYCHISVNTSVCGKSKIGNNVFLGAGTVVKEEVSICDYVVVGAGGIVISNITEPGTYVGCPVRKIK